MRRPPVDRRTIVEAMAWTGRQTLGRFSARQRSEEHTSELQSLMRISYAVFCLKKKKIKTNNNTINTTLNNCQKKDKRIKIKTGSIYTIHHKHKKIISIDIRHQPMTTIIKYKSTTEITILVK